SYDGQRLLLSILCLYVCSITLVVTRFLSVALILSYQCFYLFFFFNDTATTEIYTLSLHDALPIFKFMKDGVNATPLPTVNTTGYIDHAAFLGTINPDTNKIPKHLFQGYLNIYNNYFKAPWMPDRTEANPNELNQD